MSKFHIDGWVAAALAAVALFSLALAALMTTYLMAFSGWSFGWLWFGHRILYPALAAASGGAAAFAAAERLRAAPA